MRLRAAAADSGAGELGAAGGGAKECEAADAGAEGLATAEAGAKESKATDSKPHEATQSHRSWRCRALECPGMTVVGGGLFQTFMGPGVF